LLALSGVLTTGYAGISTYAASKLIYEAPKPIMRTPAALGLDFSPVTFESRGDHVRLQGWFIPGVLPDTAMTAERAIIVVHGTRTNREDAGAGVLDLSEQLARHGFAVLAFDMRGMGQSPAAPLSMGIYEQRDVLGAVDFLRSGPLPYPALGRPKVIGGWGVSMGASTLILAASQEPAIRAVVADCPYADAAPPLEREVPKKGGLPSAFTPGIFFAARILFGVDFYHARPIDVVSRLAPRPVFFIHGLKDTYVPTVNAPELAAAARVPGSRVQVWLVPKATHAQSFHVAGQEYVRRVVGFFDGALGPDSGRGQV
jgi:fermentation-respiration switch protein FrsA (DUF1100 family)